MPELQSQEWLQHSTLLLQARPTTTRITSKYSVLSPNSPKVLKRKRTSKSQPTETADAAPVAFFTLKTYDPASGVCLKYKTDKAAEVGRLVNGLGRLARTMAALPQQAEEATLPDAAPVDDAPVAAGKAEAPKDSKAPAQAQNTGGGGGKKKKKGKK